MGGEGAGGEEVGGGGGREEGKGEGENAGCEGGGVGGREFDVEFETTVLQDVPPFDLF